MKPFIQFFIEYRHNLADGTPAPSIHATNGKNPNNLNKKKIHTVGPYKPKDDKAHKLGAVYSGNVLMNILDEYGLDFEVGQVSKIKSSPYAIQMYVNATGEPSGKIIQVKKVNK